MIGRIAVALLIGGAAAVSLAACAPSAAPTTDPAALAQTVSARVTELARQTLTAFVSPTAPPPATVMPVQEPTPSPTANQVDFTDFEIFTSFMTGGKTQVSILVPNGIQGDYTAKIDGKAFECYSYMMKGMPRLICSGPSLPRGNNVKLIVYPRGSQEAIFEHTFAVPY